MLYDHAITFDIEVGPLAHRRQSVLIFHHPNDRLRGYGREPTPIPLPPG